MVNNDVIDDFYNVFIERDYITTIEQYSVFSREAIKDSQYFAEWITKSIRVDNLGKDYIYKDFFVKTAAEINNRLIVDCNPVKERQDLIDCIGEHVSEYFKLLYGNKVYGDNTSRFAILHLMIDMFFAYSDITNKIRWSAMLYKLLSDWNNQNSDEFNQFYGEDAEEDIIDYTLQNIKMLSNNAVEWLEQTDILNISQKKKYVADFRSKLLERKKGELSGNEATNESTNELANEPANEPANRSTNSSVGKINRIFTLCGILIIGFVLGSALNSSSNKLRNLEQELGKKEELISVYEQEIADQKKAYAELESNYHELEKQNKKLQESINSSEPTAEAHTENEHIKFGLSIITSPEETSQESEQKNETYRFDEGRRVREWKDTDADNVIGYVEQGQVVELVEPIDTNGWIGIQFGDVIGYVKVK